MTTNPNPATPPPPAPPVGAGSPPPGQPDPAGDGTQGDGDGDDDLADRFTAERRRGVRSGRTAMLRDLGFDGTVEEARAFLDTARVAQASQGDLEKALGAANTELATLRARVRDLESTGAVGDALLSHGVRADRAAAARTLVMAQVSGAPEALTAEALMDVVSGLKTQMPELFSTAGSPPPPVVPAVGGLHGGTKPPGTDTTQPPGAEGLAEYERRFGRRKNTT